MIVKSAAHNDCTLSIETTRRAVQREPLLLPDLPLHARALGRAAGRTLHHRPVRCVRRIESHGVASRPVPAEFGVQGFFFRYERHFVYWRRLSNGDIGIATILHERMHQIDRLRDDFFGESPPVTGLPDS